MPKHNTVTLSQIAAETGYSVGHLQNISGRKDFPRELCWIGGTRLYSRKDFQAFFKTTGMNGGRIKRRIKR